MFLFLRFMARPTTLRWLTSAEVDDPSPEFEQGCVQIIAEHSMLNVCEKPS